MKKLFKKLFILPLLTLLVACNNNVSDPDQFDGYYRAPTSNLIYHEFGKHNVSGYRYLKSLGDVNILVAPVIVKGFEDIASIENHEKIVKSFFGTSEETGWESVSSYYKKSSFGKLNIKGEVTPWIDLDMDQDDIYNSSKGYGDGGTYYVIEKVYEYILNNTDIDLNDYDLDKDGYIDALWLVYSCPEVTQGYLEDTFWAFTFWDYENAYNKGNTPVPYTYAWASINFLFGHDYIPIDAHTYIHETGHILGLEDYYDYDSKHTPLAAFDMQDFNIGDHNAYSKYAFGWSRPYVVTDDCVITINKAESSGDSILIRYPDTFNNNAFSEYLMLELLTPTGLWELDSKTSYYDEFDTKTYQHPGVRMIHVDSRLGTGKSTIVDANDIKGKYVYLMASNTISYSYKSASRLRNKYDLCAVVPQNKDEKYQTKFPAIGNDGVLFHSGDSFKTSDFSFYFSKGTLHDETTIPFEINFIDVNSETATIEFKKI